MIAIAADKVGMAPEAGVAAPARRRNAGLDWLRIFAVIGVVLFHVNPPGGVFNRSALVIFIGISVLLEFTTTGRRPRTVGRLARGCLTPWLCWSLIYGLRNLIKGAPVFAPAAPVMALLSGTAPHLWYMPFYFALSLVILAIKRFDRPALMLWGLFAVALATLVTAPAWWMFHNQMTPGHLPLPISNWVMVAPYTTMLLAAGLALAHRELPGARLVPVALFVLTAAMCAFSNLEAYRLMLFGGACLGAAWALGGTVPDLPLVTRFSDAAFGVYLSHLLFPGLAKGVLHLLFHHAVGPSNALGLMVAGLSFAFVLALHRWAPPTRAFLG